MVSRRPAIRRRRVVSRRQIVVGFLWLWVITGIGCTPPPEEQELKQRWLKYGLVDPLQPDDTLEVDLMPVCIFAGAPVYHQSSHGSSVNGTLVVRALIGPDGTVDSAEIGKTSQIRSLDSSTVASAYLMRYKPAVKDCKPVSLWVRYSVDLDPLETRLRRLHQASVDFNEINPPNRDDQPNQRGPDCRFSSPPLYPRIAIERDWHGVVTVRALVGKDGLVKQAEAVEPSGHPALDEMALKAAYWNRFTPMLEGCKPIEVWIRYKVTF